MSIFEILVIAGVAWIGLMAIFAVKHLERIEELLKELKGKRHE
jgi:hypothetical protein